MSVSFAQRPQKDIDISASHGSKTTKKRHIHKESVNYHFTGYHIRTTLANPTPTYALERDGLSVPTKSRAIPNQLSSSADSLNTRLSSSSIKTTRRSLRTQPASNEYSNPFSSSSKSAVTSAQVYPISTSRSTTSFLIHKSVSSPLIFDHQTLPPPYSKDPDPATEPLTKSLPHMNSDTEDDRDEDDMIYTSRLGSTSRAASSSSQSLRSRIFGLAATNAPRARDKPICTTPGMLCAGETETETDEPSRHLPTARIIPSSGPIVPPTTFEERVTPLLFEFSRLLSIVPAIFGTLYNLYHLYHPPGRDNAPTSRSPPERVDYLVSALWAILTGYQCLRLTTGLLTRWRLYYDPLSTLVRLLALQGICWPATHLTLSILEHEKRPVICWAVIGTTTCMSRSIQIWVTSNLWWEKRDGKERGNLIKHIGVDHPLGSLGAADTTALKLSDGVSGGGGSALSLSGANGHVVSAETAEENRRGYWKRWGGGGKWGGRRWDWKEVGVKCVLPAGILYFVMAWAEQLRREWAISVC